MTLLVAAFGCGTVPPQPVITAEEQVKLDLSAGKRMAEELEPQLSFRKDVEVSVFLRKMAERLSNGAPELRGSPLGVMVVRDRDAVWRCFSLPGNRIYLSAGLLRGMEFENEVAAAIALEFGHILRRHALNRLKSERNDAPVPLAAPEKYRERPTFFGDGGVFAYSEQENLEAADAAVGILYDAGYDPRGIISLWSRYQSHPERSPYSAETLQALIDRSRQAIALYTPLRNPIVRSEAFLAVRKRFQRL